MTRAYFSPASLSL